MTEARRLGPFGIWRSANLVAPELATGIERLGFGTLWPGSPPSRDLCKLLAARQCESLVQWLAQRLAGVEAVGYMGRERYGFWDTA